MKDLATILAALPAQERLDMLGGLSVDELSALEWHWPLWARPEQLPPGTPGASDSRADWRIWLFLAGRGAGKSKGSAEAVRAGVETGERRSIGLIAPTADVLRRDVVAAILACSPPWNTPQHEPSLRRLVWPCGAIGHCLSSEEPDRIRGLNLDFVWGDEVTSWSNAEDVYSNMQLALRVPGPKGHAPAGILSTTPKRHALLRRIIADPSTVITRAKTVDNAANLSPETVAHLQRMYGGTSLGRQELEGILLTDDENAFFQRAVIDRNRVFAAPETQVRCVVAVDPSGSVGRDAVGIVVAATGQDGHAYVLADLTGQYSPEKWARVAVDAYRSFRADKIVAEANFGAAMVSSTIRTVDPFVPVKLVHASRGKAVRAEPIVSLYEQQRVHHVGMLAELEDEMTGFDPNGSGPSPNRMDALVWACTELVGRPQARPARFERIDFFAR